ncbi:hypoxanthine-guanine phosphoribosyltransferase [uncultured Pseudoteredinibacter sp.]|uniref:hypoxanthine-guanine phosphoribosyltransferase n=1 Tax=uncultured Pseudoteredinibacter sp. TaxID=1641701 RepID=UPI0026343725|nr:hypoxanthine-guanine phosphoribosyltransferase [uncultured Pseudoteredinibacter sp.]
MKLVDKKLQAVWDSAECLHSADALEQGVQDMAKQIRKRLHDQNPLILCIMNGGLVTCGQLLPLLDFQLQLEYVNAASGPTGKQETRWPALSQISIAGRSVLLLDDIFDLGLSLHSLKEYCIEQGATQVQAGVLVEKQHEREKKDIAIDYRAVTVGDRFIFGAGLDYQGYLRNAPGIYAVAEKQP